MTNCDFVSGQSEDQSVVTLLGVVTSSGAVGDGPILNLTSEFEPIDCRVAFTRLQGVIFFSTSSLNRLRSMAQVTDHRSDIHSRLGVSQNC